MGSQLLDERCYIITKTSCCIIHPDVLKSRFLYNLNHCITNWIKISNEALIKGFEKEPIKFKSNL